MGYRDRRVLNLPAVLREIQCDAILTVHCDLQRDFRTGLDKNSARSFPQMFGPSAIKGEFELILARPEELRQLVGLTVNGRQPVVGVGRTPVVERAGQVDLWRRV